MAITITEPNGDTTTIQESNVDSFIQLFEMETGKEFNRVQLFKENGDEITSSLVKMRKSIEPEMSLFLFEGSEPVRILDRDVIKMKNEQDQFSLDLDKMRETFGPLENWNTSFITNMSGWFQIQTFPKNESISKWDTSSVEDMSYMFYGCPNFNQTLESWVVSNVKNMSFMFCGCVSFNKPIEMWDVSSVENMSYMFLACLHFNQRLHKWNISNVKNMYGILDSTKEQEREDIYRDIYNWDI